MPEAIVLLAIVFVPMLIEAATATRNERAQRARGGIEPAGDVYGAMRVIYPAAFAAMILEGLLRGHLLGRDAAAGAAVFAAAKALKWWAIRSLGPSWTFRVIVVPGDVRVVSGPYRWMRHPNYVAVVGELLGVLILTGVPLSGAVAIAVFGGLIRLRIAVEDRALDAILPPK